MVVFCFAAWQAQSQVPPFTSVNVATGTRPNSGNAIALDAAGNYYVAGSFGSVLQIGTVNFGATNLVSMGDTDGFLAKFNTQGHCLWARQMAGIDENDAYDVVLRSDGSVLVMGEFLGTNAIGSTGVVSQGGYDTFLAAFTPAGDLLWSRAMGGAMDDFAIALAAAANGSALFTGSFVGAIDLGDGITFSSVDDDALLIKLDPAGTAQWARSAGGDGFQLGSDVKADALGNVFWAGEFETNVMFGATNLTSTGFNVFIAKYDSAGTLLWTRTLGEGEEAQLPRVALGPDGRIVCTAVYAGEYAVGSQPLPAGLSDVLIASFTAGAELQWVSTFGGNEVDACTELLIDTSGDAYLVGHFRGAMSVGNTNLTSAGSMDIFLARCSPTGQLNGAARAGGPGPDIGFSGVLGASGEIRFSGSFSATAQFGGISVTSSDVLSKMFVATASPAPTLRITRSQNELLLSWPGHLTGFTLESKLELSAASWTPVSAPSFLVNGELVVTNPASEPKQFFRLKD